MPSLGRSLRAPLVGRVGGRRSILIALVVALAGVVVAVPALAQSGGPAQAQQRGGTLRMLALAEVDSIDPGAVYTISGAGLLTGVHRTLYSYPPQQFNAPVPDLAEGPPVVPPDGLSVTVRLRAGVRFSPPVNREVTSADVKYAIERGFFRTVASPYAGLYFGDLVGAREGAAPGTAIAGLETPDARTLVLRLARPRGGLVAAALVMMLTAPVPREYAAALDARNPSAYGRRQVATGPYMIQNDAQGNAVGYRPGRGILLVRNPNWVAATDFRAAFLDRIDVRRVDENIDRLGRRVLRGRAVVPFDFGPSNNVLRRERPRRRGQFISLPAGAVDFMALNTRRPPLNNVNLRRAIVAGMDRAGLRRDAGGRSTGPLATHFIPPGVPGFTEAGGLRGPRRGLYDRPRGSVRRAARFLRRAGYRSGRFTGRRALVVITPDDPAARSAEAIVRRSLTRLGFRVRFRRLNPDEGFAVCSRPTGRYHICGGGFVRDFPDAETILSPLFNGEAIIPQNNSNISLFNNASINRAMQDAQALTDPGARANAWAAIDRRITALAPAIALKWPNAISIRSADVAGVVSHTFPGFWDVSFTSLR
jgi:peptide/nickel transport system substrate-binding protein